MRTKMKKKRINRKKKKNKKKKTTTTTKKKKKKKAKDQTQVGIHPHRIGGLHWADNCGFPSAS
jgi:hypothetical protein